ncbi:MAG: tyrosine-type recombinase/integrase [bacterium]
MKDEIKGHLFKRKYLGKKQIRLKPEDPLEGKFYIQYDINRRRYVDCLNTTDLEKARQRWADKKADLMFITDEEKYLQRLIESNESKIRKLQKLQSGGGMILIKDAFDKFKESKYRKKATSEKTLKGYKQQFTRFANWSPGTVKTMRDLTPRICELYIDDLEKQEKPKLNAETVDKHVGLLEMIWNVLLPDEKNPWRGLHSTMDHTQVGYRRLTLAECKRLYEAAEGEYKTLVLLGFATGQRLIDCATLDWDQVNVKDKIIGFTPAKTKKRKNKLVLIPMSKQLSELLSHKGTGYVMPTIAEKYNADAAKISEKVSELFAKEGVKVLDNEEGHASFHSFRHTFASMLDEAGCPLQIRAYLTNHSLPGQKELMPGVTAVYSHPDIEPIRKWVLKIIPKI